MNEGVENEKLRMQIKKQCFWFTLISLVNEEAAGAWYSAVLMSVCVCYLQRLPHMVVACPTGRRMQLVAGLQRAPLLTGHPEHHTN